MLQNPEVIVALTDVRTGEREIWRKLGRKAEKYKQTLQEIKEIADVNKNYKFKITEGVCIGDTVELKFDVVEQILNKIKEVEDE